MRPLIIFNQKQYADQHCGFLRYAKKVGIDAAYFGPNTNGVESLPFVQNSDLSELLVGRDVLILYRVGLDDMAWIPVDAIMDCGVPVVLIDCDCLADRLASASDLHLIRQSDLERSPCANRAILQYSVDPNVYEYSHGGQGILRGDISDMPIKEQSEMYGRHLAAVSSSKPGEIGADIFQIAACGALVFTQTSLKGCFKNETYVTCPQEDVEKRWNAVNHSSDYWSIRAMQAAKIVRTRHSHAARWSELVGHINDVLGTDYKTSLPYRTQEDGVALDRLRVMAPDILDYKSVLYVGASKVRSHFMDDYLNAGYDVTLVEAFKENAEHHKAIGKVKVVHSTIQKYAKPSWFRKKKFDVVFWWHGPEHVGKDELPSVIDNLEKMAGKMIVLGVPWGITYQGDVGGNPYENHVTHLLPEFFIERGYEVECVYRQDRNSSGIIAVKRMEA